MGLTANVVSAAPILASWGNEIRDRSVQNFASVAERSAQWTAPPEGSVSYCRDVDTLSIYNGTAWVVIASGGGLSWIQKRRTAGDYAVTSTSWADLDNATWETALTARVGDVIAVTLDGTWLTNAGGVGVADAYATASSTSWGISTAGGTGVAGWSGHAVTGTDPFNGTTFRKMVSGDLSGGNVTIRLRYRATGATHTLYANSTAPLTMTVQNLGGIG